MVIGGYFIFHEIKMTVHTVKVHIESLSFLCHLYCLKCGSLNPIEVPNDKSELALPDYGCDANETVLWTDKTKVWSVKAGSNPPEMEIALAEAPIVTVEDSVYMYIGLQEGR